MNLVRNFLCLVALLCLLAPACRAPAAEPIEGDIASLLARGIASGEQSFDHTIWDELLKAHAKQEGRRFDYAGLKAQEEEFSGYLGSLAKADLASLSRAELKALCINAYNAFTVNTILENVDPDGNYGITSIRDVPDVFDRVAHDFGGFRVSLNNIEHNILRPMFRDPRVHFAVNCASISCPPLPPEAFEGPRLDEQLDRFTRLTLQNPDYARVDGDTIKLTRILDWYGGDFVNPDYAGSKSSLAEFVAVYSTDALRRHVTDTDPAVEFFDYDWNLNRSE